MEQPEIDISKQFGWKKVMIPILLGLLAAGYLLTRSLNEERFVEVGEGKGDYVWTDSNHDGVVDRENSLEFVEMEGGTYIRKTFSQLLEKQHWNAHSVWALSLALLMVFIRDLGYMSRIRILTDYTLSWRQSFRVIMLWEFASALTPSVVGGSGVAIFILNREGISLGKSTSVIFVTALMDELFYIVMVPLVFVLLGSAVLFPDNWHGASWFFSSIQPIFYLGYGFILMLTSIIALAIFFYPHKFKRLVQQIFTLKVLRRWLRRVSKMGDEIILSSKALRGRRFGWWMKGISTTFVSWTARFMTLNFILLAFNPNLDHLLVLGKQLVMWVVMLISPTPGSSGVAELALDSFFSDMFDSGVTLLLVALMWRLVTYFIYLFMGIIIFPKWLRTTR